MLSPASSAQILLQQTPGQLLLPAKARGADPALGLPLWLRASASCGLNARVTTLPAPMPGPVATQRWPKAFSDTTIPAPPQGSGQASACSTSPPSRGSACGQRRKSEKKTPAPRPGPRAAARSTAGVGVPAAHSGRSAKGPSGRAERGHHDCLTTHPPRWINPPRPPSSRPPAPVFFAGATQTGRPGPCPPPRARAQLPR